MFALVSVLFKYVAVATAVAAGIYVLKLYIVAHLDR